MNIDPAIFVTTLGWALLHFLWQGALIGLAAAALLAALRNARPQARYAVACAALALCLLLPARELWLGLASTPNPVSTQIDGELARGAAPSLRFDAMPLAGWRSLLQARMPWIVALWSFGVVLLWLRMLLGLSWVRGLQQLPITAVNPLWQARIDLLALRLGLRRKVSLRIVERLDSPVAAGLWRPVVFVPAALLLRLPPELLEALLAHELAHVRRHDYLVNLLQCAVEALLFYHPVVWWLSRRIRIEREQVADDLAASVLGEPRRLALALQELDRFQFSTNQLALAANGGNLMSRIQRLIRPSAQALNWKMTLPVLGIAAIGLAVYAQANTPLPNSTPIAATFAAPTSIATPYAVSAATPAATPSLAPIATPDPVADPEEVEHEAPEQADRGEPRQSYALVRAGHERIRVSSDSDERKAVESAMRQTQGDFLWFRHDGQTYVIQDPTLLAEAAQAWGPSEALGERMDALGDEMEPHSRRMEALGKQMEELSALGEPNTAAMDKLSRDMETLANQQASLNQQMEPLARLSAQTQDPTKRQALDSKLAALQAQMAGIGEKMSALGDAMEAQSRQLEATHRPMQALSAKMAETSRPMEALGRQLGALGKQQEQLSRTADHAMKGLIEQALHNGQARPVDSR